MSKEHEWAYHCCVGPAEYLNEHLQRALKGDVLQSVVAVEGDNFAVTQQLQVALDQIPVASWDPVSIAERRNTLTPGQTILVFCTADFATEFFCAILASRSRANYQSRVQEYTKPAGRKPGLVSLYLPVQGKGKTPKFTYARGPLTDGVPPGRWQKSFGRQMLRR